MVSPPTRGDTGNMQSTQLHNRSSGVPLATMKNSALSKASNCNSMWFPNTDQEFQMVSPFGGMRWTLDQRQALFFRVEGFAEATLLSFIRPNPLRFKHLSLTSIGCCLHVKLPSAALMALSLKRPPEGPITLKWLFFHSWKLAKLSKKSISLLLYVCVLLFFLRIKSFHWAFISWLQ